MLIEQSGGSYRLSRDGELLLVVPQALFDTYAQDSVFPPSWPDATGGAHPVRRLYWNPENRQFLMAGLERHPARVVEGHGLTAYRSFLQGFWLPEPPVLLLRPFWNPPDPYAAFDQQARARSLGLQLQFHRLLAQMRPPHGWATILNATDAYLEALGITSADGSSDPEAIHELSLIPPLALGRPPAVRLLDALSQEHLKTVFPLLRDGALCGLHTLGLDARHGAEALLETSGSLYQPGILRPH
ncbi:MAG TPA: hypothetical protein VK997_07795 [Deferrisomatales bacterium]|nr:hypothetical protein [Deferrisomatales bacterium]